MRAWDLGTISGIRIRVHWSFLLLPMYIYFSSLLSGSGMMAAIVSIIFVLAIFGCVLLHELGHALAARQFGIGTRDITLLPIGGVAALERMPRKPWQELWIAVAGPLVNVVIAATLFIGIALSPLPTGGFVGGFLRQLALANVILVVFNMIPAFPMDGGRVLRSVLAMFVDYSDATAVAVTVGKVVAVGFGLLGLFSGNLMLLFVAAFVYLAAHSELSQIARRQPSHFSQHSFSGDRWSRHQRAESPQGESEIWFSDDPSGSANRETLTVPATLAIRSVAAWLSNRHEQACSVIESGTVLGQITRSHLMEACAQGLGHLPVGRMLSPNQSANGF